MPATYTDELRSAQSEVLARLLKIVRESASETQIRLAAAVILRLRVPNDEPQAAANPPTPAAASPSRVDAPLTPREVAELTLLLPSVKPARFTAKHTPKYWRAILDERRRDSDAPIRNAA